MDAVKCHLLVTVLATQACALYEGAVPYFPIEISRTAASSPMAMRALAIGFVTLGITLWRTQTLDVITGTMWLGLVVVAAVPDTLNWVLHMAGVAVVFAAAVVHAHRSRNIALVPPLVCAVTVYALRIVLKVGVMLAFDPKVRLGLGRGIVPLAKLGFARTLDVMMLGPGAYGEDAATLWPVIAPIFKVCGVLQWVAFYALSFVL